MWENEWEGGELIGRFGRANAFTYNRHIHTHIHSHKHSNGLYRSLKAVATNDSSQERTKQGSESTYKLYIHNQNSYLQLNSRHSYRTLTHQVYANELE